MMKKSKRLILSSIIFIMIGATIFCIKSLSTTKEKQIEEILKTDSYSYLPQDAKNLVKQSFLENDILILTEKNQQEDQPFLNPKYIEYLEMSDEEKGKQGLLPNVYVTDWSNNYPKLNAEDVAKIPDKFDLRDQNAITELKNQGSLSTCWTYAVSEIAESYLLQNKKESAVTISPRQIDYATSINGIKNFNNEEYGLRNLTTGGSFFHAAQVLATSVSLIKDDDETFSESIDAGQLPLENVLNFDNSLFEMNESVSFYRHNHDINLDPLSDEEEYRNNVKKIIMENGGAIVGTQAPHYSCGSSTGEDGTYFVRVDGTCTEDAGHAMQIIGWDDNYEYNYCNINNKHEDYATCVAGSEDIISGKGAWLLRNSWGNDPDFSFVYLAYDSQESTIEAITDLSTKEEKNWDNEYSQKPITTQGNAYRWSYEGEQTFNYEKKTDNVEKIAKVKFNTATANGTYTVNVKNQEFKVETTYPGYYTLDLSSENITFEDNEEIIITVNGAEREDGITKKWNYFLTDSIIVTTQNINENAKIYVDTNPIQLPYATDNKHVFNYVFNTSNISSNSELNFALLGQDLSSETGYKILNDEDNIYNFTVNNNKIAYNNANPEFSIDDTLPDGVYSIVTYYGNSPITSEEDPGVFATLYFYKGERKSIITYKSADKTIGEVSIESEAFDPFSGRIFKKPEEVMPIESTDPEDVYQEQLSDKKVAGSTAEAKDENYNFINWTTNSVFGEASEDNIIISEDAEFVPGKINETYYNVYPTATYYANFAEKTTSFTYNAELNNLGNWEGNQATIWFKEGEEEAVQDALESAPVKISSGAAREVETTLVDQNGKEAYYKFDGWYDGDTLVSEETTFTPTKDEKTGVYVSKTYTAKWHAINWQLHFTENSEFGSITDEQENKVFPALQILDWASNLQKFASPLLNPDGDKIWSTANAQEEHYTYSFDGWFLPNSTEKTDNFIYEIEAKFSRSDYLTIVIFNQMYDSGTSIERQQVPEGEKITKPQDPTANNLTFDGWYTEETYKNKWDFEKDTVQHEEYINLYAKWLMSVNINYSGKGDNTVIENVILGTKLNSDKEVLSPEVEYYELSGWYTDDKFENEWNFDNSINEPGLTLYAKWTPKNYNIVFSQNIEEAGTIEGIGTEGKFSAPYMSAINIDGNTLTINDTTITATPSEDTNKFYNEFDKWIITDCMKQDDDYFVSDTCKIKAEFKQTIRQYTIKFVDYNDTEISTITPLHYGDEVTNIPADPTRQSDAQYDYSFAGWEPEITTVTGDQTYKATYNSTVRKYDVYFDTNGSNQLILSQNLEYGSKIEEPTVVEGERMRFEGWYLDPDDSATKWNFDADVITGEITLIAKWYELHEFTVTVKFNNGTEDQTFTAIENSILKDQITEPTREWYNFAGFYKESTFKNLWNLDTDKISDNLTLHAKWTPKSAEWEISSGYTQENQTIIANTSKTLANLKQSINFKNSNYPGTIKILESDETTEATERIKTGQYVKIYDIENEEIDSRQIVVKGDLNGDGIIDSGDLLKMRKHLINTSQLSGSFKRAAMITDGDTTIDSGDLLRIRKHLIGTKSIE